MPVGVARSVVIAQKVLPFTIPGDTANIDFHAFAVSRGYSSGDVQITNPVGVEIYSASYATPAAVLGAWPAGTKVKIINRGKITGAGGPGGNGAIPSAPGNGLHGGTALDATSVSGYTAELDNAGGVIQGGGGGGGGGNDFNDRDDGAGGGGGGGGEGRDGGPGGAAGVNAQPGTAGTPSAVGAGGAPGTGSEGTGAPGGNGGLYGVAGANGGIGGGSNPNTIGGAAGIAIAAMGHLTVSAAGTITGPTT